MPVACIEKVTTVSEKCIIEEVSGQDLCRRRLIGPLDPPYVSVSVVRHRTSPIFSRAGFEAVA